MPETIETTREKQITKVSIVGIITNILLGVVKIIFGVITKSIAITSDAVNNLTDSSSRQDRVSYKYSDSGHHPYNRCRDVRKLVQSYNSS